MMFKWVIIVFPWLLSAQPEVRLGTLDYSLTTREELLNAKYLILSEDWGDYRVINYSGYFQAPNGYRIRFEGNGNAMSEDVLKYMDVMKDGNFIQFEMARALGSCGIARTISLEHLKFWLIDDTNKKP